MKNRPAVFLFITLCLLTLPDSQLRAECRTEKCRTVTEWHAGLTLIYLEGNRDPQRTKAAVDVVKKAGGRVAVVFTV
jgi:hypothetical protein